MTIMEFSAVALLATRTQPVAFSRPMTSPPATLAAVTSTCPTLTWPAPTPPGTKTTSPTPPPCRALAGALSQSGARKASRPPPSPSIARPVVGGGGGRGGGVTGPGGGHRVGGVRSVMSPPLLISVVQATPLLEPPPPTTGRASGVQDPARSQPTLHFQEPPPREPQRKRGKSENRPRPKSMINAVEVSRGAEWARAQRLGSTLSLNTDVELSESSSHSSLASVASGGHSVRPKARTSSTRRRQDSQGRRTTGSTSRAAARQQPAIPKQTSLEAASESE